MIITAVVCSVPPSDSDSPLLQSSATPAMAEVMKTKEQLAEEKQLAMSVRIKKLNLDVSGWHTIGRSGVVALSCASANDIEICFCFINMCHFV